MAHQIRRAYVDCAVGQMHYRRTGRPDAPKLVLLHQTPSTSAMYEPLMHALAPDFDLIAPDTPGFGGSDPLPGDFSIEAAAAVLLEAVQALGVNSAFWFGHHTGAALALQVASDAPGAVTRLAMSGPCLLNDALREALPKRAAPVPLAYDGSHLKTVWDRIAAKDAEVPSEILQRDALAGIQGEDAYPQAYRAVTRVDTAAQLQALRCPTFVFCGTEDPLYPQLDAAYRMLRHGRRAELPGARTFVCERQTEEVAALLRAFFGAQDE